MWSLSICALQLLVLLSAPSFVTSQRKHNSDDDICGYYRRQRRTQYTEQLGDRDHSVGGTTPIFEPLDDSNIEIAVDLWLNNRTSALARFGRIEWWDVLGVTNMRNLFKDETDFDDNIAAWDVSCVINFHGMFWGASSFNQDISGWNVQSATNMYSMFRDATSFNQDLPWAAPFLLDMTNMFYGATNFNGDLSLFDTSSVVAMQGTFRGISYNRNISNWNVENVFTMSSMFEDNPTFNSDIANWYTKSLESYERMFFNAASFDQDLCWHLEEQEIASFQVFCETEGSFDEKCVSKTIVYNSERRCTGAIEGYIKSFTDFFQEVQDFFDDCLELLGNLECFSPEAMTPVENVGWVAMKDLQVGDKVLTSSGDYQPVYSMFHSSKTKATPYLQIHTSHSQNSTGVGPLELTANHMLHVVGYDNPIPAWQVKVGDFVYVMEDDEIHDSRHTSSKSLSLAAQPHLRHARVMEIQNVIRNGLYNPLTPDGTIVVDGISASAYASFLGTEYIHLFRQNSTASVATFITADIDSQDGWKVMSHQDFVHLLLGPYRFMCLYVSMDLCKPSQDDESHDGDEDSEWYGRLGQLLLKVWLQQHVVVQAGMFGALVGLFGLLNILLSPLGLSVALTIASSSILYRKSTVVDQPSITKTGGNKKEAISR